MQRSDSVKSAAARQVAAQDILYKHTSKGCRRSKLRDERCRAKAFRPEPPG